MSVFHIIHKRPISHRVNAWLDTLIDANLDYTTEVGGWDQLFVNRGGEFVAISSPAAYLQSIVCARMDG